MVSFLQFRLVLGSDRQNVATHLEHEHEHSTSTSASMQVQFEVRTNFNPRFCQIRVSTPDRVPVPLTDSDPGKINLPPGLI